MTVSTHLFSITISHILSRLDGLLLIPTHLLGSFHGSKLLDQAFEDYIEKYIPKWSTYGKFHCRILRESCEYSVKPSFDNSNSLWVVVTIVDSKVSLDRQQIAECFDKSVLPGIKVLAKKQVNLIKNTVAQDDQQAPHILGVQLSIRNEMLT